MMTPNPLQPAGNLASALVQMIALDRDDLTVLAAAAQALVQAQAAQQSQLEPSADWRLPAEPPQPIRHGRVRRRSSQRTDTSDAPDRHAAAGCGAICSDKACTTGTTRTAVDAEAKQPDAGRVGESGITATRLAGRGRIHLCRDPYVDPELFSSRAYRRRLGPTVQGLLYVAGCEGLLAHALRLDEPLYKIGVTEGSTTAMRMSSLAATRYGSVMLKDGSWFEEVGFGHWEAAALPLTRRRGRSSPVSAALGAISYERPISLPRGSLDRALTAMLTPASLAAYAASPADREAYRGRGLDPISLERYSPAPLGRPQGRTERARELVLLGPRANADALAAMLELIISRHVMLRRPA